MLAYRLLKQKRIPLQTAAANPDELTRQLPRGLYSTFITNHGGTRVLGLTAHLDRLYVPAQQRRLTPSASRADLRRALASLAADSPKAESRFRILLTESDGTVYVIVQPFTPLPKEIYEHGVKAVTADLVRRDPRLKDTGFITQSQSARAKVAGDIFEVLLIKNGRIYEGMTSNFYAVHPSVIASEAKQSPRTRGLLHRENHPPRNDGILVTARSGILLGVTRRTVLRLARAQGMDIEYRPPRMEQAFAEAFLTSSSRGIVPIVRVDSNTVGEGRPGAWTKRLALAYQAYVEERSEPLMGD